MANDCALAPAPPGHDRPPAIAPILAAQVRYQLTLLIRTPRALIASLILPGVLLALRLGRITHGTGHAHTLALATTVAGLSVFGTLGSAYMTHASGLIGAREEGVLRRWRAAPLPTGAYFTGRITATVLLTDAANLALILTGIAMAGLHVTGGMILSLLLIATLGALTFSSLGTAVTVLIPTVQGANPVLLITYLPLLLFSGALGSIAGLPHWLISVMDYLPARPLIEATTTALTTSGQGVVLISGHNLAVLAAWTIASIAFSIGFFRWDPHRPAHARRDPAPLAGQTP